MNWNLLLFLTLLFLMGCGSQSNPGPGNTPATSSTPQVRLAPEPDRPKVENPAYLRWAKFTVGTTVSFRETTESPAYKTETITSYRLKTVTDDRVILETKTEIKSPDGTLYPVEPLEMVHLRWYTPQGKEQTPQESVSELTVLGKNYKTKSSIKKGQVEAGETITETWYSDEFPGGMVKSVHKIPASQKTVTAEVVKLELK